MKVNYIIPIAIALVVLLFGCAQVEQKQTFPLGETFTVKENQIYYHEDNNSNLLLSVLTFTDSRCPSGVQCFWQGEVGLEFSLNDLKAKNEIQSRLGEVTVKSTTVLNYSIELVSIDFNKKEAQIKITPQEPVYACTMDAKICPDGVTYVGRIAPDCNFAPCPDLNTSTEHLCTVEEKSATICTLEYMPVCGKSILNTGAVTYATYGNKCGACAEMKVVSYVPGECVPSVPTNCTSWYDGCNTCFVTDGNIMGCTKKYCEVNTEAYCMQYATDVNPGIANPASTNCIDNNGTLSIVDTNEGQVGMCTLPSGKVCEEWAYLRGECTQ